MPFATYVGHSQYLFAIGSFTVTCCIVYCNSLLYGVAQYELRKLQKVQNSAGSLVCYESKYCLIPQSLKKCHW